VYLKCLFTMCFVVPLNRGKGEKSLQTGNKAEMVNVLLFVIAVCLKDLQFESGFRRQSLRRERKRERWLLILSINGLIGHVSTIDTGTQRYIAKTLNHVCVEWNHQKCDNLLSYLYLIPC
jgi:hypothetical protein